MTDRAETEQWKTKKSALPRMILKYVILALIPVLILGLMYYVAKH